MPANEKNLEVGVREGLARTQNVKPAEVSEADVKSVTEEVKKATEAYKDDKAFYRYAIYFLFSITIVVVVFVAILEYLGKTQIDGLISIGAVAVGALAAIFAKQ